MARLKDRERAIVLRKKGMSYSQIKKTLQVSKGTLSVWLKDYPLSEKRIKELRDWNEKRIENCRKTKLEKKEKRLEKFYQEQRKNIFPFNKRELYFAGLFLYWGEGAKSQFSTLSVSNSNPSVIIFFIVWLIKSLKIPKEKLKVRLHLYQDMNIKEEINFWSKILNIPLNQFAKPYIKKSLSVRINHKGGFRHGTCNLEISNARLAEKTHMAIKAIANKYNKGM